MEGPVNKVTVFEDLLIWSNKMHIYVKNFTREEAIVQISRPDANPLLPNCLYAPKMSAPAFSIRIDRQKKGTFDKPVYYMVVAWFNLVRRFTISFDKIKGKYK